MIRLIPIVLHNQRTAGNGLIMREARNFEHIGQYRDAAGIQTTVVLKPAETAQTIGELIKERQYFAVLKHLLFLKSQIDNSSKRKPSRYCIT